MFKASLDKINLIFAEIAKTSALYLPVDQNDGSAAYKQWKEGVLWSDALNTVRSPKDFFFPQTEDLMRFKTEGKNIEVIDVRSEIEDFVVFGVRACDVKSFDILDRVFLTEPRDSFYASRREHGIIVSVACTRPSETCFCKTFGITPEEPAGDVTVWKTDSEVFFKSNTEKGEALMKKLEGLFALERQFGGVLDIDTATVSSLTSFSPGYIDKENEYGPAVVIYVSPNKSSEQRQTEIKVADAMNPDLYVTFTVVQGIFTGLNGDIPGSGSRYLIYHPNYYSYTTNVTMNSADIYNYCYLLLHNKHLVV